jgi:8-oxo-dGTP diphosphatase
VAREYPTRPLIGTGALIFQHGNLLLIKRGAQPGQGKWSVPGGLVELGETVQDAMIREVKEEVGLDVEALKFMDVWDSVTLNENRRIQYHFVIVEFLVRILGGVLKTAGDALEAKWVPLEEVEKYNLTDTFRKFFEKHRDELKHSSSSIS